MNPFVCKLIFLLVLVACEWRYTNLNVTPISFLDLLEAKDATLLNMFMLL